MKHKHIETVHIYYQPAQEKIPLGTLIRKERTLFFEYQPSFLALGLNVSPFKLPLQPGLQVAEDGGFIGLFGLFNDSLPDGWNQLLLNRKLNQHHINPHALSPLDRLCFVGALGMGALRYEPQIETDHSFCNMDLDATSKAIHAFQTHEDESVIEDLLQMGGSSAGARPKIMYQYNNHEWIIKFRSSMDPKDIGNIEYAYYLMAKAANLKVAEAHLFPSKKGGGFFGSKRFDRTNKGAVHMHTISGLLHADHRLTSLDYQTILQTAWHLTQDIEQCKEVFRLCIFNVLTHNRDDHAKNFAFLMHQNGKWSFAPAYDLTFSSGPAGEHSSTIMGEGKNPGKKHIIDLAHTCNISTIDANTILSEVKTAAERWPEFAANADVAFSSTKQIQRAIEDQLGNP